MFCPNCGTKINENGAFCPNCGSAVQEETIDISSVLEKEEKPEKVKKTKKKLRIVIACVLTFAILVVGTIGGLKFFGNKNADIIGDVNYTALTEGFTDVLITDEKSAIEAVASIGDTLGIKDANSELKATFTNKRGTDNYYRLQQYYKDIPVFGRNITVVADESGKSLGLTSNYSPIEDIDTKPSLNEEKISEKISKAYDGVDSQTNNGLIVYTLYNSSPTLAYDVTVSKSNSDELIYEQCIISAKKGDILLRNNLIRTDLEHSSDEYTYKVNDKTYLMYDESRNVLVLNSNKKLLNYETIEKDGVKYLAVSNDKKRNENANPLWDKNQTLICGDIKIEGSGKAKWKDDAVNLINSIENTYDFYSKILKWNGYDNKNSPMLSSYDDLFSSDGNNAYSQGNLLVFGYKKDLTDVGLVGHEFTHSVESAISGMIYSGESGAIMEAYSDIFGELAEDYAKDGILNGDCDWIHGSRNMIDPSVNNYPARYLDDNWKSTVNTGEKSDYGNVHTNNTVISHAAYLMSSGVNGNAKIDNKSLAVMWFNALNMLQSDSDLSQCRNAVELSARIMVKNKDLTEEQYKCVIAAFKQVGILRAAYTNKNVVKNQFTLSVLNYQKTENVSFNLTIYQRKKSGFDLFGMGFGIPYTGLYEVYNKNHTNGNVKLDLESGTYDFYITEDSSDSETIITRVVVDKSLSNATDKFTVYTDFMDVITIILNKPSNDVSEETLKSKLTAQTTKTIQAFTCDDFDNDGKKEAFAFVGDKENDDAFGELFTGELWYINDNTVKQLKSYSTMMTDMYSKINYVVEFSDRKFLCLNNLCGNYSLSEIWCVVDGQPKECNISGYGQGTVTVEHNAVALTNSAYDAAYDSSTNSYIGHTWKPYYYYWDESTRDFKEYGGVKITKEQFLNIKGASDIINTILNGGNEIVNILYRENGMININYKNNNSYDNANLLYNEKSNTLEVLKSGFTTPRDTLASSYGGTYQEEIIESIATYPKKLPEVFNNTSSKPTESTTNSTTQNRPETPKYPLEGEYDEVLAKGDGYYLVSKFEESYDSAATLYGVVSDAGTWVCPLSANNEFAKAANNIQDGYSQSYHKIKYDYLGDKIFVIKNCSIILGRETIPSGYWGVYESHGGCVMVDVNGKYINSGGYIITEFKDGYAFTECGNAGLVYRLDKNGNQTKVRYVDDYFGIPSEGLVCLSYIFYDIETLTPTIDLNEYDMVTKSKDLRFKNGELYFEFKNPAGTKYHVKIDKTGKFLYDPVKMD